MEAGVAVLVRLPRDPLLVLDRPDGVGRRLVGVREPAFVGVGGLHRRGREARGRGGEEASEAGNVCVRGGHSLVPGLCEDG